MSFEYLFTVLADNRFFLISAKTLESVYLEEKSDKAANMT